MDKETPMVLVVDDDRRVVKTISIVLRNAGFRVETATNGADAHDRVASPDCVCVVLDINMPVVNGCELLQLMMEQGLTVPVIVITGSDEQTRAQARQYENVIAVLEKPFDCKVVVDLLRARVQRTMRAMILTGSYRVLGDITFMAGDSLSALIDSSSIVSVDNACVTDRSGTEIAQATRLGVGRDQVEIIIDMENICSSVSQESSIGDGHASD